MAKNNWPVTYTASVKTGLVTKGGISTISDNYWIINNRAPAKFKYSLGKAGQVREVVGRVGRGD